MRWYDIVVVLCIVAAVPLVSCRGPNPAHESHCCDGIDSDEDGLTDCADPDCFCAVDADCNPTPPHNVCPGACVADDDGKKEKKDKHPIITVLCVNKSDCVAIFSPSGVPGGKFYHVVVQPGGSSDCVKNESDG